MILFNIIWNWNNSRHSLRLSKVNPYQAYSQAGPDPRAHSVFKCDPSMPASLSIKIGNGVPDWNHRPHKGKADMVHYNIFPNLLKVGWYLMDLSETLLRRFCDKPRKLGTMSATLTTEFRVTRQVLLTFLRMFHPRYPTPTPRGVQGFEWPIGSWMFS